MKRLSSRCFIFSTFSLLIAFILCSKATAGEDADFRRGHGYYTLQEYKLAAETFEKYLSEFSKSERADIAQLLLAECRYQLKEYPAAAAAYDKFVASFPNSQRRPEALLRATKVHFLLKEPDKSLAAADAFLKENRPKLGTANAHPALPAQIAEALYYAGEASFAQKNLAQAKSYWEELIRTQPESKLVPDASEGLGWIHFDAKEYDLALTRFKTVSAIPNHPRAAWSKLMEGRALGALKKHDDALAAIKAAQSLGKDDKDLQAEAALRSAEILLSAENFPEALRAYKTLAKDYPAAPTTGPALAAAAFTFVDKQRQAEAQALADLYLSVAPNGSDRATIERLKARALATLSDTQEAIKTARKGVEAAAAITDPKRKAEEHPAALMLLAELLGPQGTEFYQQVVQLYPETRFGLAARYELARLLGQAGKNDEALKQVEELLPLLEKADPKMLPELRRDAAFAAAEFAFRKQDYRKTEQYLKAYESIAGTDDSRGDDVARKMAWCLHHSENYAGAGNILDAAFKKFSRSQYRDEMLYLRALTAAKLNAPEDALKFNETLVSESPSSSFADDALYDSAAILYKQNKADAAIGKLTALLEQKEYASSPLKDAARQLRASAYLQAGKNSEAVADAEVLLKQNSLEKSRLPSLRLIKALALTLQPGKQAEAEAALGELIQAGPADSPEVRHGQLRRAYLRFENKQFALAKDDFASISKDAFEKATPETLDAALRLALCHKELKDNDKAKALLEKLAQAKLDDLAAFEVPFQLGNLAFEANDNATAKAQYERALSLAANLKNLPASAKAAASLNLAWALKRLGEAPKAENAFADVVKFDPDGAYVAEALYERARILDEISRMDDAIQAFTALIEKKPDSPLAEKALLLRSQKQAKAAKFAEATSGFETYLKKYSNSQAAREAWCGLAECRMQGGDAKGAREGFTKALGEKGFDAELDDISERSLLGLAELSLKQGDALAGKKSALRILTDSPNSTWRDAAYFMAGQCSEQLGEPEKAIGYYRKLLAEHPKSVHAAATTDRLKALGAPK